MKHKTKYNHGDTVYFWDDENWCVVEGTVVFIYESYIDSIFEGIDYVLSTKDKPLPLDINSHDAWRQQRYNEEILCDSYLSCLENELIKGKNNYSRVFEEYMRARNKVKVIECKIECERYK